MIQIRLIKMNAMSFTKSIITTCAIFLLIWGALVLTNYAFESGISIAAQFSDTELNGYYEWSNYWVFIIAIGLLFLEALRLGLKKLLTWDVVGDGITNFITLYAFLGIGYLTVATVYIGGFYIAYEYFSVTQLPTDIWTILACIILADIAYYWEHRMMHRVGIGWATHTVHHSSPYFNISVAYRFGPLDGILPFFFHLPLALARLQSNTHLLE